jgi:hypothetical protein
VSGPGVRASRVAGRVPDPNRPGRRPACAVFWGFSLTGSAGRGYLVRPHGMLWNDIFVSNTD